MGSRSVMVTGAAGFIGANFVRYVRAHANDRVVIVDKLTYAGHRESVEDLLDADAVELVVADIADAAAVREVIRMHRPWAIVNFAAESHVDRSIDSPAPFIHTNTVGTCVLLEEARHYLHTLEPGERAAFRFLHVSTDEVYGTLGPDGLFSETTAYAPNSPYAASKAAADHFVRAYFHTYGLPTVTTNCSNNYGPYQFPEKLIPLTILNALEGKPLPIYGDGMHVRDWLYVEDHCEGLWQVLTRGRLGEKYNLGGHCQMPNIQIVEAICRILEEQSPAASNKALAQKGVHRYEDLKTFVADRPGHDRRYAIDATKITNELGWTPRHSFAAGLRRTVEWYVAHRDWCRTVQANTYGRERLGLSTTESGAT